MSGALTGRVAVVAGATRGAGRGIAVELGAKGATVLCTGRSTRAGLSDLGTTRGRPETIDETAELVTAAGGIGVPVRCDHLNESDVQALAQRVRADFGGLDVLVNDVWGGERHSEWGKKAWELDLTKARALIEGGLWTHLITGRHLIPLLRPGALIVEVTDGDGWYYRGNLIYDLAKTGVMRLAQGWAHELEGDPRGITSVSVTPGYLRSEEMLAHFGVEETRWRDATARDPNFAESETPRFVGRAVAALAADPDKRRFGGRALASWTLMDEYGFTDVDGRKPHWGNWFRDRLKGQLVTPDQL